MKFKNYSILHWFNWIFYTLNFVYEIDNVFIKEVWVVLQDSRLKSPINSEPGDKMLLSSQRLTQPYRSFNSSLSYQTSWRIAWRRSSIAKQYSTGSKLVLPWNITGVYVYNLNQCAVCSVQLIRINTVQCITFAHSRFLILQYLCSFVHRCLI